MSIEMKVPYALAVYGNEEIEAVLNVLKSHKTMLGKNAAEFERKIAMLFAKKHGVMVNSGSSANLLAFEILNLPKGSEVITPITTFSTTVTPIVQKGLVPVFTDVEEGKYIVNVGQIENLITDKTKALMIPSLIGNIPDYARLREIADEHKLWLIEDSCDTLGATLNGKSTGEYTDISTTSFYGSHIITAAGGGGMVCINDKDLEEHCRVLRGWGRSSEIASDDLEERFKVNLDGIQYDSKFVFESIGYNFLPLEISAAFGLVQLEKLPEFAKRRKHNFEELKKFFSQYKDIFILPKQINEIETSWLAFPLTIKAENVSFERLDIVKHLEMKGIQTRPLFAGNIIRHPGFKNIEKKMSGQYPVANSIMQNSLLIGCHQGIENWHLEYLKSAFTEFLSENV